MASKMAMVGARGDPQAASEFLADSLQMANARLEAFQSIGDIFGMNLGNIYNVSHTAAPVNITDQIQKVQPSVMHGKVPAGLCESRGRVRGGGRLCHIAKCALLNYRQRLHALLPGKGGSTTSAVQYVRQAWDARCN